MTKKTTRNGGKSGAGKGSTPRTKSAGQRSGKPAKTGKSLPPWMPDLPPTGGGAKSSAPATRRAAPARTSGRFVDPHAQREAQRYDQPIASREAILGFLEAAEGPQTAEEIAGPLGLQAPDRFEALSKRLGAMVRDGQLVQNRRGGFAPVQHTALIAGTVIANPDGFGFLRPDAGGGDDLFLPPYEMRKVMHGDRALANVTGIDRRGRREGSIARVLERGVTRLIGRFGFEVGIAYVAPDDKRIQRNVQIPQDATGGARDGQLVVVELTQAPDARRPPIGKVIAVLGDSLTPSLVVEAAIHGHNLPHEFPQEVLDEATAVPLVIEPAMIGNRVDLRDMPLVTIDGADAKDFDDAVYCESNRQGLRMKNRSGYRLVVAIADVAHYVPEASALDVEALARGNSYYFPQSVEPMLPERERIGGSRAQGDLVEATLLQAYLVSGRDAEARRLATARRAGPARLPVTDRARSASPTMGSRKSPATSDRGSVVSTSEPSVAIPRRDPRSRSAVAPVGSTSPGSNAAVG